MKGPKVPSKRGAEGRRAEGLGSAERRRSPSTVWDSGGMAPRKFSKKINVEIAHFPLVLVTSGM